jgi:hypothetical protein
MSAAQAWPASASSFATLFLLTPVMPIFYSCLGMTQEAFAEAFHLR